MWRKGFGEDIKTVYDILIQARCGACVVCMSAGVTTTTTTTTADGLMSEFLLYSIKSHIICVDDDDDDEIMRIRINNRDQIPCAAGSAHHLFVYKLENY